MRKLLLASAAMLGATAGLASAQTAAPNPAQGQLVAPYGAGPAANNNNNSIGAAMPGIDAVPAPGTVVVRLNGRVEVDVSANFGSGDRFSTPGTAAVPAGTGAYTIGQKGATAGVVGQYGSPAVPGSAYKLMPQGIGSWVRIYPGIDGLTTNGIRYGAAFELRENWAAQGSGGSGNSSGQTMFVRRAFTYIANDKAGIVRFGQGDGVISLFDNGTFTSQGWDAGVGNINGGGMQQEGPFNTIAPPFVWLSQAGNEYGNNKVVYLSPQFMGFDFGLQYAPDAGNSFANAAGGSLCTAAAPGCATLSSSSSDSSKWINQYAAGIRYQGTFGPVGLQAFGVYMGSGKVGYTGPTYAVGNSLRTSSNALYDDLAIYNAGVAMTFMGFTVAADYIGGAVNGQLAMRPTGGKSTNAVVTGLKYTMGPLTLGGNVGIIDTQGDARLVGVSQRHEFETSFGGNYVLAPGLALVGEYMYTERHQGGFDFVGNGLSPAVNPGLNNTVRAQGVMFATVVIW